MGKTCIPKVFSLDPPDFHRGIADAIQDPKDRLHNIIAPRGHAKTSVAAIGGSLWHLFCDDLYNNRPRESKFVLLISRSRAHAINLLTTIKNTLEFSKELQMLFGYHGQAVARKWGEDFVILDTGDVIMAKGMGQQVRGLNIYGRRPTFIALDDAEDEENTKTPERMEANLRWFLQALVESGAKGVRIINIGTPQHERCIVFTLKDLSEWRSQHYHAINIDDDGKEYALWPELRPLDWLKNRRDSLENIGRISVFYREYQCEVVGDEDQLFPPHVIQRWSGKFFRDERGKAFIKRTDLADDPVIAVNVFMGVDPASSIATNADFTVIMTIAMDADKNRYVLDLVRKRMKPIAVGDAIMRKDDEFKPEKMQIETVGYQSMLSDYIRKESQRFIPGSGIKNNPRRGKTERLEGLQPSFWQKKVWIREGEGYENMEHFIDELMLFPRGKHDDTLDGYFYANKGAYPPYHDSPVDSTQQKKRSSKRKFDWMVE